MKQLEICFNTLIESQNGVGKLREMILTLAMQGKLVPQNPNDEPASELLKKIKKEKQELIKDGKIKKDKPLPPIKDEEIPYKLPKEWKWVRLGETGNSNIGLTYKPTDLSNEGTPVLRANNIQNGSIDLSNLVRVSSEVKKNALVSKGDILICVRSGSRKLVGKSAIIENFKESMAFGAFMSIFRSRINRYILLFINSPLFRRMLDEVNTMTINQITQSNLKKTIIPLPPLAEQQRIVAKIEQLMAICDKLGQLQQERKEKLIEANKSALKEFSTNLSFLKVNFDTLYSVHENINELKKAILTAAMQGKLVPQNPNDEPASELLKKIKKEKQELIKAGKIKKDKPLPPIKDDEIPYQLPKGWEWVMLIEIGFWALGSGIPLTIQGLSDQEILVCKVSDMNLKGNEKFIFTSNNSVSEQTAKNYKLNISYPNTIVFPKIGGAIATNKRRILGKRTVIDNNCLGITAYSAVDIEWLYKLLLSFDFSKYQSGTSVPAINQGTIGTIIIALPPLSEQQRIVAKIEQLMSYCDSLTEQIDLAEKQKTELIEAVMANISE